MHDMSDDTRDLVCGAFMGLKCIYRAGYKYKKVAVMLMSLSTERARQGTLFEEASELASLFRINALRVVGAG
ncbi:hypothetical protein GCM10011396_45250 [Undibacterium terreum]|uniref:Uncharacterized protein n=2 Tax=Undibacterium terreum TaxID=1224302 RepID=A0A916XPM5_9BURK|nr:hypothetical protein GCM10011396_45250 [Undibacterium terreum]